MEKLTLIRRGAEANLYSTDWFGLRAISKVRVEKHYRRKELDEMIRAQRTIREATLIYRARLSSLSVPIVFFVDPSRGEIIMEEISGKRVKELFEDHDRGQVRGVAFQIGRMIGQLHKGGIVHGDLTTSNMIMRDHRIYLIDFGLSIQSDKLEDRGVDIRLLKGVLSSAHASIFRTAYREVIAGYRNVMGGSVTEKVLGVVEEIERRGRYARVE